MTCLERIKTIRNLLLLSVILWTAASILFFSASAANATWFGWPASIVLALLAFLFASLAFGIRFFNVMGPPSRELLKDCCGRCTDLWQTFDRWLGNYLAISATAYFFSVLGVSSTSLPSVGVWPLWLAGLFCAVAAGVAAIAAYWAIRLIKECLGR